MTNKIELPKVLPVTVGTIFIPSETEFETLSVLESYCKDVVQVLSLIPDVDKAAAEFDEDGYRITTDNMPALIYATNRYFLDDFCTAIHVVLGTYGDDGEICQDCIDDMIEEVSENYTGKVLTDGLYLIRGDV